MISRKFAYADHLALLHSSGNWKDLEGTLSQDMSTVSAYLQTWRLKLSHTKTVTAAFHLNNREAKCELKVYNNDRLSLFCPTPTYLVIKLDRSLTFRHHLVALRKKLSSRVTLLRRLDNLSTTYREIGLLLSGPSYNTCVQARVFYCFSFFYISREDFWVFFLKHPIFLRAGINKK